MMRLVLARTPAGVRLWAALEDDRRCLRLKWVLLTMIFLLAALLEVPR
jgi:hypothetical protein